MQYCEWICFRRNSYNAVVKWHKWISGNEIRMYKKWLNNLEIQNEWECWLFMIKKIETIMLEAWGKTSEHEPDHIVKSIPWEKIEKIDNRKKKKVKKSIKK